MIDNGACGERMARYLHLNEPPLHATLGFGASELAVTRLRSLNGFSDLTSLIPSQKAFSIHASSREPEAVFGSRANWVPPGNDLPEE